MVVFAAGWRAYQQVSAESIHPIKLDTAPCFSQVIWPVQNLFREAGFNQPSLQAIHGASAPSGHRFHRSRALEKRAGGDV
jgi:hypothetical protein